MNLISLSSDGMHTGKYSFDMFTHLRASMDSPSWYVYLSLTGRGTFVDRPSLTFS